MSFCSTTNNYSMTGQKTPSLQELKEAVKRCTTHGKYKCNLMLPLKTLSTSMATTLYLNIYEINVVAKSYILLWKTCQTDLYINVELLCHSYPKQYHNLLQSFFYDKKVYWDEYFLFVCCFLFCDIYQITNLLLSICRIHSNLIISREQIQKFYNLLCLTSTNFGDIEIIYKSLDSLIINLTPIKPPKVYSLKNFTEYMNNSTQYQQIIINFRQNMIMSTLSLRIYKNIKLRQDFYDLNGGNKIPPSEPLLSILYRRLFTHEPPPYYYDFGLQIKKGNELNQVVNGIRHLFGYSTRIKKCVSMPNCYMKRKSYEICNTNEKDDDKDGENKKSFLIKRKVKSCLLLNNIRCNNYSNCDENRSKLNDVLNITDKSYFHKKQMNFLSRSKVVPFEECDNY